MRNPQSKLEQAYPESPLPVLLRSLCALLTYMLFLPRPQSWYCSSPRRCPSIRFSVAVTHLNNEIVPQSLALSRRTSILVLIRRWGKTCLAWTSMTCRCMGLGYSFDVCIPPFGVWVSSIGEGHWNLGKVSYFKWGIVTASPPLAKNLPSLEIARQWIAFVGPFSQLESS